MCCRCPHAALMLILSSSLVHAAGNKVSWTKLDDGLELASAQKWRVKSAPSGSSPRAFEFTALRFHLGYYEMRLVDILEFANKNRDKIATAQGVDKELPALFELGLRSVFQSMPSDLPIVAVAPAGFPSNAKNPINYGLLKTSGVVRARLLEKGPSAVLCLNNAPSPDFEYQVPAFFWVKSAAQRPRIDKCKDAVQVGPVIIEDAAAAKRAQDEGAEKLKVEKYLQKTSKGSSHVEVHMGIPETAAAGTPYMRAVFAVDDPGRFAAKDEKAGIREIARNGYLIVTTIPVTLWDVQDMLKSREFYANEQYAPHWAVNLAGDNYAGLIFANSISAPLAGGAGSMTEIGGVEDRQTSVLVVTRRK